MNRSKSLNGQLAPIVEELARSGVPLTQARNEFERQLIVASLDWHRGSIGRCAEALGIHRNTLRNKVDALRIRAEEYSRREPPRSC